MDWLYKAALTAAVVAIVLMTVSRFSRRLGGLLAGLPVITAPALFWLVHEQGADFAALAATGSVAASAAAALYALAYGRIARRLGPLSTLLPSLALGGLAAMVMSAAALTTGIALLLALAACTLTWRMLHPPAAPRSSAASGRAPLRSILVLSGTAALVSLVVSLTSLQLGPYWSGLLASVPIISTCALVQQHVTLGGKSLHPFLAGYVDGLLAKAVFAASFAWLLPHASVEAAFVAAGALGLACAAGLPRCMPPRVAG
ncbi:MAG: hypothetical protein ACK5XM_00555 [Betaproteobacteria bacterium]